ncbi:uncharacterized protein LOC131891180 [Tigriopus californicus]|uniref:uncharacterized protein LOC131891180 n=1 Tax=Tigriopus californicus TaxID=6832 RepID=UPI0027D9F988|nr:uncharacterized protein LOC131891180 [Tigriopus californicus]
MSNMMPEQSRREIILGLFPKGGAAKNIVTKLKGVVGQSMVFKTIKDFKEKDKTKRKPSTCQASIRTRPMVKRIREKIRRDPRRSIRKMAKEESVSVSTMWRLCRKDLGMIPYKKQRRQTLSNATKVKRQGHNLGNHQSEPWD